MMRRKGIFTLLTAACMVLAFTAVSFAANLVAVTATVPNIPKSACYQAGALNMTLDTLTTIATGDVITYTLNSNVTVCQPINMFLRLSTNGTLDAQTVTTSPVTTTGGTISAPTVAGDVYGFLIQAAAGNQVISLTLQTRTAGGVLSTTQSGQIMTFTGTGAIDTMIVKIFDQKVAGTQAAFFKPLAATPTVYDTAIVADNNTICINTLPFLQENVVVTVNSAPVVPATKLTFTTGGEYPIAHILSEQNYSLFACKAANPGRIALGTTDQSTSTCAAFSFEDTASAGNYCTTGTDLHKPSRLVIQAALPFLNSTNYTVKLEILVNDTVGANGVYWSNVAPGFASFATTAVDSGACASALPGTTPFGVSYLLADGTAATPIAQTGCASITAAAKAVTINTISAATFPAADRKYLFIDLPPFNYNLAEVHVGDTVKVRVTLAQGTCGVISTLTIPIGTFGCLVTPGTTSLTFPYFTGLSAGDWWNGIVLVNMGTTAGTFSLTAKESDGTVVTFTTPSIPAGSMYVNLLESIPWVGTGIGSNTVGVFIKASSTDITSMDGFGMIAKETTGESMGYLPR